MFNVQRLFSAVDAFAWSDRSITLSFNIGQTPFVIPIDMLCYVFSQCFSWKFDTKKYQQPFASWFKSTYFENFFAVRPSHPSDNLSDISYKSIYSVKTKKKTKQEFFSARRFSFVIFGKENYLLNAWWMMTFFYSCCQRSMRRETETHPFNVVLTAKTSCMILVFIIRVNFKIDLGFY